MTSKNISEQVGKTKTQKISKYEININDNRSIDNARETENRRKKDSDGCE